MMLIDAFTFVWPAAFAIMLIASAILFVHTRRLHFLVQAAGFAALVASQVLQFVYAPQFEPDNGMIVNSANESLAILTLWLSVCGLGVAAIGYVLQCIAALWPRFST